MKRISVSHLIKGLLMLLGVFAVLMGLSEPAFADYYHHHHHHYYHHNNNAVFDGLIVGAAIGMMSGVAIESHNNYYYDDDRGYSRTYVSTSCHYDNWGDRDCYRVVHHYYE